MNGHGKWKARERRSLFLFFEIGFRDVVRSYDEGLVLILMS